MKPEFLDVQVLSVVKSLVSLSFFSLMLRKFEYCQLFENSSGWRAMSVGGDLDCFFRFELV